MFTFVIVIITLIAVLMTIVILLQSGQGGGLAGIASGGATRQVLGSRQAPDLLEKATWVLAGVFIFLCLISNFVIDTDESDESVIQRRALEGQTEQQTPTLPPADGGAQPLPGESGQGSGSGDGAGNPAGDGASQDGSN